MEECVVVRVFTFHNVSINTIKKAFDAAGEKLYIPQCFY